MTGTHEHIITQSCEGAILTHCISNPHSYSSLHSIIHTFLHQQRNLTIILRSSISNKVCFQM